MKSTQTRIGIVLVGLALGAAPAWAQRANPGSSSSGAAVSRGAEGGAPASSNAGAAVSSGPSVSAPGGVVSSSGSAAMPMSAPSAPAAVSSNISVADRGRMMAAPEHRAGGNVAFAQSGARATGTRSAPSGNAGARPSAPVTRSTAGPVSSGRAVARSTVRPNNSTAVSPRAAAPDPNVPAWARPRGNRPSNDTAVARPQTPVAPGGLVYYDPYYFGPYSGYYGNGFYDYPGFGMGYGFGLGLGWYPYFGDPWAMGGGFDDPGFFGMGMGGGGGYATSSSQDERGPQGHLRLKVKPRDAKVYVDGYYVGVVDQFDGTFQHMTLATGRHHIEVKAEGYETATFDVSVGENQTVTFQGDLKKLQ